MLRKLIIQVEGKTKYIKGVRLEKKQFANSGKTSLEEKEGKMIKKVTIGILLLAVVLTTVLAACTPAPAPTVTVTQQPTTTTPTHPMVSISQWTAPFATGTYNLAFGMEDLSKKHHPWLRLQAAETPGYAYNIKSHAEQPGLWDNTVIAAAALDLFLASKKVAPYADVPNAIVGYRRLLSHASQLIWLVSLNPDINSPDDLAGKKIAIGTKSQTNVGVGPSYLLVEGMGLDPANIQYIGHAAAMTALLDGLADVAVTLAYANPVDQIYTPGPPQIQLEASGKTPYYIGFPQSAFDAVRATGIPSPSAVMPAGKFTNQNEEILAYGTVNGFFAKDVFPEDVAYEITKFWLEYGVEHLEEYTADGKLVTPGGMIYGGIQKDFHPGALRAYEEAGISIPEK